MRTVDIGGRDSLGDCPGDEPRDARSGIQKYDGIRIKGKR